MKNSFVVLMVLCAASALAMPTKDELSKAQSLVVELMADDVAAYKAKSKKAEEIGDTSVKYAQEASTEAAKFLLLKGAISYYVRGESYDKAADAVNALREAVPDVPPDVLEEIIRKNTARVTAKKAPRLYAIYQTVQVQVAAAKEVKVAQAALAKKPKDEAAIRKLAEAQALSGDWKAALGTFAKLGSKSGAMAKSETEGKDLPSVADFWWDYESYLGEDDADAFKMHAAAIYRKCLADGSIDGLKKNIVEKRIKGYAESTEPSEQVEEKLLTYEGYLPEAYTLLWEGVSMDAIQEFTATFAGKHVTNPAKVVGYVVKSGKGWKEVQFQIADDAFLKCVHAKFVQKGDAVCGSAVKAECADSSVALGTDFTKIKSVKKYWLCFSDNGEGYGIKDLVITIGGKGGAASVPAVAVASTAFGKNEANLVGQQRSVTAGKGMTLPLSKKVAIEFVPCPAGSFMMGRKGDEAAFSGTRYHKVNITRKFWMSKYKITKAQWEAVDPPTCAKCYNPEAQGKIGNLPVYCVSFNQVRSFCGHVNKLVNSKLPRGYVVRLPTEAEWEYALAAGCMDSSNPYLLYRDGNNEERARARSDIRVASVKVKEEIMPLAVEWIQKKDAWDRLRYYVGTRKPNNWGIYDMLSNGSEYMLDTFWHPSNNDYVMSTPTQRGLVYEEEETDPLRVYVPEGKKAVACMIRGGGDHNRFDGEWFRKKTLPTFTDYEGSGFHLVIGPDLVSEWKAKNAKK